jgi:hypothetical protein
MGFGSAAARHPMPAAPRPAPGPLPRARARVPERYCLQRGPRGGRRPTPPLFGVPTCGRRSGGGGGGEGEGDGRGEEGRVEEEQEGRSRKEEGGCHRLGMPRPELDIDLNPSRPGNRLPEESQLVDGSGQI